MFMSTTEMALLMGCSHVQASKMETVPVLPSVWCGCAVRLQLLVDCCDATTGHWYTHTWYKHVDIMYKLYDVAVGTTPTLLYPCWGVLTWSTINLGLIM